jgi:hypothetical protein
MFGQRRRRREEQERLKRARREDERHREMLVEQRRWGLLTSILTFLSVVVAFVAILRPVGVSPPAPPIATAPESPTTIASDCARGPGGWARVSDRGSDGWIACRWMRS